MQENIDPKLEAQETLLSGSKSGPTTRISYVGIMDWISISATTLLIECRLGDSKRGRFLVHLSLSFAHWESPINIILDSNHWYGVLFVWLDLSSPAEISTQMGQYTEARR